MTTRTRDSEFGNRFIETGVGLLFETDDEKKRRQMDIPPIVVTIPHSVSKAEARRRIEARIEDARVRHAARFKVAEETWNGDRLTYRVAVIGQPITGNIEIGDDNVRIEAKLSWYLGHLAKAAEALIAREGAEVFAA